MRPIRIAILACLFLQTGVWAEPLYSSMLVEPLNNLHNHGSCVVELSNGDVLMSWYKGTGERKSDDVRILGARLPKGGSKFSEPFEMADFPGYPDCNSSMVLDKEGKLWLFWPLIVANQWETALLMSRYSTDYLQPGAPNWKWQTPILLEPGEPFAQDYLAWTDKLRATLPKALVEAFNDRIEKIREMAQDKYARRNGWMPRAHPVVLPSGRILLPLYSDGYSVSLFGISDDNGKTWSSSRPILSIGGVQPTVVWKKDGSLVAYMRDNGPPPKRVITATSTDAGLTWTEGEDMDLLESGAGVQAERLPNGHWLLVHNDLEEGRYSLVVRLSEDEGKSWKWSRHLELFEKDQGSGCYPSLFAGSDGIIHGSYSYDNKGEAEGEGIKYVRFNEEWIQQGDAK